MENKIPFGLLAHMSLFLSGDSEYSPINNLLTIHQLRKPEYWGYCTYLKTLE